VFSDPGECVLLHGGEPGSRELSPPSGSVPGACSRSAVGQRWPRLRAPSRRHRTRARATETPQRDYVALLVLARRRADTAQLTRSAMGRTQRGRWADRCPPRGSPPWGTDARPVLALQVELCSPRLLTSRARRVGGLWAVGRGSGQQGQYEQCTPSPCIPLRGPQCIGAERLLRVGALMERQPPRS